MIKAPKKPSSMRVVVKNPARLKEKSDTLSGLVEEVTRLLSDPIVLVTLIGITVLVTTHAEKPAESWITQIIAAATTHHPTLGKWLTEHTKQFVGMIVYGITAAMISPSRKRGTYLCLALVGGYVIPESSAWQYVGQSFAAVLWMKARRKDVKTLVIVLVVAAYFAGYLIKK